MIYYDEWHSQWLQSINSAHFTTWVLVLQFTRKDFGRQVFKASYLDIVTAAGGLVFFPLHRLKTIDTTDIVYFVLG